MARSPVILYITKASAMNKERGLRFPAKLFAVAAIVAVSSGNLGYGNHGLERFSNANSADNSLVSVRDYGAKGDGKADDSEAIQKAINAAPTGGTVFFPAGIYQIGSSINIDRNNVSLMGVGVESVIRRKPLSTISMITIPSDTPANRNRVPENITISKLTIDGNKYQVDGPPNYRGIWVRNSRNVTISQVYLHDHRYESIASGTGDNTNENLTIRQVHISSSRRQAIHIGQGRNTVIDQVYIEKSPDQLLDKTGQPRFDAAGRPASEAGTGIDIETQGYKEYSFVDGVQISNSIIDREAPIHAGAGISISPAYGPVKNVAIRNNVVRNHQIAVMVNGANNVTGVEIDHNFFLNEASYVSGFGSYVDRAKNLRETKNVITDLTGLWRAGLRVVHSTNVVFEGNTILIPKAAYCAVSVVGVVSIDISHNNYTSSCAMKNEEATGSKVIDTGNTQLRPANVDAASPTVRIGVRSGTSFSRNARIAVSATDAQSGVARVYLFVDGIPQGYSDADTASFDFNPEHYENGPHTLGAMAVDNAAHLSRMVSVPVVVNRATKRIVK